MCLLLFNNLYCTYIYIYIYICEYLYRRQDQLKIELTQAFKCGDEEKVRRIERKLAPDAVGVAVKHPWA